MWFKRYKDYPIDAPLLQETVESGKGVIGCEMHDRNGWGIEQHQTVPIQTKRMWRRWISSIWRGKSHAS